MWAEQIEQFHKLSKTNPQYIRENIKYIKSHWNQIKKQFKVFLLTITAIMKLFVAKIGVNFSLELQQIIHHHIIVSVIAYWIMQVMLQWCTYGVSSPYHKRYKFSYTLQWSKLNVNYSGISATWSRKKETERKGKKKCKRQQCWE